MEWPWQHAYTYYFIQSFINNPAIETMDMPIASFLSQIRQHNSEARSPTISVQSGYTIAQIITKLASSKVYTL